MDMRVLGLEIKIVSFQTNLTFWDLLGKFWAGLFFELKPNRNTRKHTHTHTDFWPCFLLIHWLFIIWKASAHKFYSGFWLRIWCSDKTAHLFFFFFKKLHANLPIGLLSASFIPVLPFLYLFLSPSFSADTRFDFSYPNRPMVFNKLFNANQTPRAIHAAESEQSHTHTHMVRTIEFKMTSAGFVSTDELH